MDTAHPNDPPKLSQAIGAAEAAADSFLAGIATTTKSPSDDSGVFGLDTGSFPGYQVVREIHRGGQGVVYQAIQKTTKRKVAIKVMREGPFAGTRDKARFDREVEILGRLSHPNIVTIHDSGAAAGHCFFVMDYISGQPLDIYMASGERTIESTLRLFLKICDAVNAAHLRGIIHRDLKPGNIRIDASAEPHILDFGLAKVATGDVVNAAAPELVTITGQFVGSLPWASPEQAQGRHDSIDLRTDVYSLGVVLYQMLTRRFPYEVVGNMRDVMENIIKAEPRRPRVLRRDINDEVETIVLKCLAKERDQRYETAGELARDLRRYLAGEPIAAKRASTWYLLRKSVRRHRLVLSTTAIVTLAVIGTSVVYSYRLAAAQHDQARAEQVALTAQKAQVAAEDKALQERRHSFEQREHLAFLLARVATNAPLRPEKLEAARELLADLAWRMREQKLGDGAVEDLGRLVLTTEVRGRRLTGVGIDPRLGVRVATRPNFCLPGISQVVTIEAAIDGQIVEPEGRWRIEAYGEQGSGSSDCNISSAEFTRATGSHVLTGKMRVRFYKRAPGPASAFVMGVDPSDLAARHALAECTLPIPAFQFTVAEGVNSPLEIKDAGLAAAAAQQIDLSRLTFDKPDVQTDGPALTKLIPLPILRAVGAAQTGLHGREGWRLTVQFGEQFAYLAGTLEIRDARDRLLATTTLVVDPKGRPCGGVSWDGNTARNGQMTYRLRLEPEEGLERSTQEIPIVSEPVTVQFKASRAAALSVPEVDAYLGLDFSRPVTLIMPQPPQAP